MSKTKDAILKLIENAIGDAEDNCYRAEMSFMYYSEQEMLEEHDQSGQSRKSILDGYQERREELKRCYEWMIDLK